jgi:hypothetical protein
MGTILRHSGLTRRLVMGTVVALSASLAVMVGTSSPASASSGYRCGTDFPWGPFCQVTYDRRTSLTAKALLVRGAGPVAVATWLCQKAPWFVTVTCVFAAAKDGAELRDALSDAKHDPTKCVAIRMYHLAVSRDLARGIRAVGCFPTGATGGGGGGGGGGSWRPLPHPFAPTTGLSAPDRGAGGGGSW